MYKRSFISFVSLLTFWIVISAEVNLQHMTVGIVISLFTVWFWEDLDSKRPSILAPKELLLLGRCIVMLIGYVIQSNIDVARTLLFSDLSSGSSGSIFLEMEPGIESDWGRVFLSTCITITPGTVTIDVDPETNVFTVHALTRETGEALFDWRIISEIKNLERLVQGREAHVVDTGGIHVSDSVGAIKSDYRTHRN